MRRNTSGLTAGWPAWTKSLISPSLRAPERHMLDALNVKAATLGFCWTAPIVAMS
jgi:hypothetical protein